MQGPDLVYVKDNNQNPTHLEDDIRTFISQKFADARVNHYTRWNHTCIERLNKFVINFEMYKK